MSEHEKTAVEQKSEIPDSASRGRRPLSYRQKQLLLRFKKQAHEHLIEYLDLKRSVIRNTADKLFIARVRSTLQDILTEMDSDLPGWVDREEFFREIYSEVVGLGPLEVFMEDDTVSEIMVNRRDQIFVEREGCLELTDKTFVSDESIMAIIERIIGPIGRRIDESQPLVDARLADGSRVHAIIPPLSLIGPVITIRKFLPHIMSLDDFVKMSSITAKMAAFLRHAVLIRANIVVTGKTSTGKTTLLNLLSSFIPESERIVTIEDSAELALFQDHIIRLEGRPPNIEGKGEITIRELFRNSLRMRPDRIIIGECRSGEALDMLQAMNTGHDGSLTTVHANSPHDLMGRLESLALIGAPSFPITTLRSLISSAINLVVHLTRYSDGSRKVTQISELVGQKDGVWTMEDIYRFRKRGHDPKTGKVTGEFETTGYIPRIVSVAKSEGYDFPMELFAPTE